MNENLTEIGYDCGAGSEALSDMNLLAAARAGVDGAYGTLCERYRRRVLGRIRGLTPRYEDCEDAIQDAMFRAFLHLDHFREHSAFSTWFTRIAINSSLMAIRKQKRSKYVAIDDLCMANGQPFEPASGQPTAETLYIRDTQLEALQEAIKNLSPRLRVVVEMRVFQNRSVADTARQLGLSVPAVKSRMLRAKQCLAERLNPRARSKAPDPVH